MLIEKIGEGDTIEQARENARRLLNAPEYADIKFDIICAPTKKILGLFGGKKAQVKASYEKKEEKPRKKTQATKAKVKKVEKKPAVKKEKAQQPKAEENEEKKREPVSAERLEKARVDCEAYVKDITSKMLGTEVQTSSKTMDGNTVFIHLDSGDHDVDGMIIGHRGETLDAIQYLASLVANKGHDDYVRVTLDVANYREKRETTLTALAHRTAKNALRTGRRITLEPMNPYERHIIHTAVQDIEGVTSHSIGSNIDRRVVITPEEGAYRRNDRRGGGRKGGNRNRTQSAPAAAGENREPKKDLSSAPLYGIVTKADNDSDNENA
ncbi:MAG: KH domain-containing protein [Ruminococcaceae bacterium]|nr:KH domain-containing protein [Oscillospiraceae bacterium]